MFLHNNLVLVLAILIIVLIIKQFLESGYFRDWRNTLEQNKTRDELENIRFQKQLENIIANTKQKIDKAVEKGYLEAFKSNTTNSSQDNNNKQGNGYLTSYLNKTDTIKIQLFYKANCKYCANFMPTWNKIINNLPNDAKYEEIDCNKDLKKVNENKITSVPTIILLVNNEKKVYMGNRTYNDIDKFLRYNGVNLVQRQFEDLNFGKPYFAKFDRRHNLNLVGIYSVSKRISLSGNLQYICWVPVCCLQLSG
jgi:thiol-disulfide isomerase/thioredoxin